VYFHIHTTYIVMSYIVFTWGWPTLAETCSEHTQRIFGCYRGEVFVFYFWFKLWLWRLFKCNGIRLDEETLGTEAKFHALRAFSISIFLHELFLRGNFIFFYSFLNNELSINTLPVLVNILKIVWYIINQKKLLNLRKFIHHFLIYITVYNNI
jgi:hypothetical protein